ncbi:uncharacterized protein LOC132202397 isoform X2 [Neocloeon triangulifer]|uniref:uncharacterized protein LOC132202397 isoform X2 n=1 Tax=Neocloeon triangulifer TaxID=2078957 RepID=UPI00286F2264|nr:uncharacterized protein LOC132202397 isoform X2 [Neocloeon triangulifer]
MSIIPRIPQLAVSAKFLCLLMFACLRSQVAICGAVPGMVHSVRLHNDCSSSELQVTPQGKVFSSNSLSFNELRLESVGFGKLTIFAERSARYLCFNKRWRLVGAKKKHGKWCQWQEVMEDGFNRYRSLANLNYSLAVNPQGQPMRGEKTVLVRGRHGKRARRCGRFLKRGLNLTEAINRHNKGDHPIKQPLLPQPGHHQHRRPRS